MGDTVFYGTDTPGNVAINVATGATGAVVTINVTGPTGASGNYTVSAGSGASGATAMLTSALNNLRFVATGTTRWTSPTGLTGITGATGLNISVATGPSGPVVTFDYSSIANVIENMKVSQNYDPASGEMNTGATYNGKPVYRRAWNFCITALSKTPVNANLVGQAGYVDSIINSGGYFATGNQGNTERYNIPATFLNWTGSTVQDQVHGYPVVSTSNQLQFVSLSTKDRNKAPVFIWVEYTRVNDSAPVAPSGLDSSFNC
jgi:hypothetical protein